MLQIRKGTFETNSSSTHSLVMCSDDEYNALLKKEAFVTGTFHYLDGIIMKEDLMAWVKKNYEEDWKNYCLEVGVEDSLENLIEAIEDEFDRYDSDDYFELKYNIHTFNSFIGNWEVETFDNSYTTKNNEVIHAFGSFGHD